MIDLTWTTQRFVSPPASIIWLWVVTPGSVVSWGALLAESGDRTRLLLSALGERMDEARRCMTPLQRACVSTEIPCQTYILHGAVAESVVRLACSEAVEQILLATNSDTLYGQLPQELAATLTQRLSLPVGILE